VATSAGSGGGDVLVAIDVGTSGARASAFALDGEPVAGHRVAYPTLLPREGWAEQDANRWRAAALSALGRLVHDLGTRHRILAIGLTGQCPSMVPVDGRSRPLRAGIIYRDNRAEPQALAMRAQFGDEFLHTRTGHLPAAFHVVAKMLWIREHEPEVFAATRRFVEPSDHVATALTGEPTTDWTMAAASGLLDLRARTWATDIVDGLGFDVSLLPEIRPSWSVIGELRPSLATRFGLAYPVPVVAGGGDSLACAFGAGVTGPGPVSEMAGSSTCLNTVVDEPLADVAITHYPSALSTHGYVTEVGMNTTGEAVGWLARLMYAGRSGVPRAADFAALDREAASVAPGAGDLMVVPALGDGERDDPHMRGIAVGMSLRHGRAHWARAVFEGVAFGIRAHVESLGRASTPATEFRVSGGSADLRTWNQVKADVLGIPVIRVPGDAASAGVAMLAGLGVGAYAGPDEAIARACRADPPIEPDAASHARYDELYERYRTVAAASVARVPTAEA
jgi:sugar (pentulose or hexulose) kinase